MEFSVLNRKCGWMRDSREAKRARSSSSRARSSLPRIVSYANVPPPNATVMTRQSPRSVLKTRQYALHGNNPIQPSIARLTKHPAMASATQAARKRIQLHGARYLPHLGPILVSARYAGTPILTENINEMPKERPISRTDDPGPVSVIATTAQ